ncbi:MAG: hypothetical protein ACHQYP_10500 [Nitrospiria bacterium]
MAEYLSDIYTELHQIHKDTNYLNEFQKVFSVKGKKIESSVLNPAYQIINNAVEELDNIKFSEDRKNYKQEIGKIKHSIGEIQTQLNLLIDLGLYDESQTKIMRDRVVKALKSIALDLHNVLNETEKAISLLSVALTFVGTSGLETLINQQIVELTGIKGHNDLGKPIRHLIDEKDYENAWNLIQDYKDKYKDDPDLKEFLDGWAKHCIQFLALEKYNQARTNLDNKEEDLAETRFDELGRLIFDNLYLFNINKKAIDDILLEIREKFPVLNSRNASHFDEYRDNFIKSVNKTFEGQPEENILIVLIDSHLFSKLAFSTRQTRRKAKIVKMLNILGLVTVFIYGFGFLFFIASWIYEKMD